MEHIKTYIQENKDRFLEELMDLLRIPSISADPLIAKTFTLVPNPSKTI